MSDSRYGLIRSDMAKAMLLAVVYFVVARLSLGLSFASSNASPVWPPAGIALAGLLLIGSKASWGVLIGAFSANFTTFAGNQTIPLGVAILASALIAVGNLAEAWLAALISRRFIRGAPTDTPQGAYLFALAAATSAIVAASSGVATLLVLDLVPSELASTVWLTWWLGDVVGLLVVAPLLMQPLKWRFQPSMLLQHVPAAFLFLVVGTLTFSDLFSAGHVDRLMAFGLVVFIAWSAYKHGAPGATTATFSVAALSIGATIAGNGPFAKSTVNDSLISLDGFLALCALAGMVLAASQAGQDATATDGRASTTRQMKLPTSILLVCLAATLLAWHLIALDTERRASERFEATAEDLGAQVRERFNSYERILRAARGLFAASINVGRNEWQDFVEAQALSDNYPGILGLGFAPRILPGNKQQHVQDIRADGWPSYAVNPPGNRGEYVSVIYLEPLSEANRRAIGYDMFSEPIRRAAMLQARDTGSPSITGRVTLVQGTPENPQPGLLMYLPVYVPGAPAATQREREVALMGYVYAAFQVRDLMQPILKNLGPDSISLKIYEGDGAADEALMFAHGAEKIAYPHQLVVVRPWLIAGKSWTAEIKSTQAFESVVDAQKAQIALVAGTIISLLLFTLVRSLAFTRQDALSLAERMSAARVEADTRFQSLAESASAAILVLKDDGRVAFCNHAGTLLFGREAEQMENSDLATLLDLPDTFATLKASLVAETTQRSFDTIAHGGGGAQVPVEVELGTWLTEGRRHFSVIVRDISARKLAEDLLRQANDRFSIAADSAGIGVWELDLMVKTLVIDDRMYDLYRIDRSSTTALAKLWEQRLHPDDKENTLALFAAATRGERDYDTEFRIVWPNGEVRHLKANARVIRSSAGVPVRMAGINLDITERKRAELALRETSSLLSTVLDSASEVALIATEPDLTIKVFNRGAERMLGYASKEVVGLATPMLIHDAAEVETRCRELSVELGRTVRGGEVFTEESVLRKAQEWLYVRKDGQHINVSLVVTAMRSDDGALLGYLGIAHDVTRQKQIEDSLRRATHKAEQASLAKSQFLANMSHEIRTPLNAVIGLSYLLGETALKPDQASMLTKIRHAGKSLLAVINQVLDISKIEAGELMLERVPFSLPRLLTELTDVMSVQTSAKGLLFEVETPDDLPVALDGDPTRLNQILTNLLSNAIKFTDDGRVKLSVHLLAKTEDSVTLRFRVLDTGIGIPADAQTRIFTPFAQADESTTRRFGGTGLGLSIVKRLVTLLGGEVGMESTPGLGSEFWVDLPFSLVAPDWHKRWDPAPAALSEEALAGVRVLVVDDSTINLEVAKQILERRGAQVEVASNGLQALDRLRAQPNDIDVVLMDVQMPVLDGHAATRRIRDELNLPDLPIIALTAGALSSERQRALGAGMNDFISKPFEPQDMVRRIRLNLRSTITQPHAEAPVAGHAVSSPWPQIEGIDSDEVRQRLADDQALFRSILRRLVNEFADISIPADATDASTLALHGSRMHKLRGSAGLIAAKTIQDLAAEAEMACSVGDRSLASSLSDKLSHHLHKLARDAAPVLDAIASPVEDGGVSSEAELDPAELADLVQLLRQQSLAATQRFERISPQLRRMLGREPFELLQLYVENLRFAEAARLIELGMG